MSGKVSYFLNSFRLAAVILLLFFVGQLFAALLQAFLLQVLPGSLHGLLLPLTYLISYLPPLLYIYYNGMLRPLAVLSLPRPPYLSPVVVLAAVTAHVGLVWILDCLPMLPQAPENFMDAFAAMFGDNTVYTVLTMCIFAPLLEELMFRRVILSQLRLRIPAGWAVLISALLFALAHGNLWQGVPAFVMGLLFGWVYLRTRSYLLVVGLHALNNTVTVTASALMGPQVLGEVSLYSSLPHALFWLLLVVAAVLLVAGLLLIKKFTNSTYNSNDKNSISSEVCSGG